MQLPEDRPAFKLPQQQKPPVCQSASLTAYGDAQQMQKTGSAYGSKRPAIAVGGKLC